MYGIYIAFIIIVLTLWLKKVFTPHPFLLQMPSPKGIPILGNILNISPDNPGSSFSAMAEKLGGLYVIFMLNISRIVVCDPDIIREAIEKKEVLVRKVIYDIEIDMFGQATFNIDGNEWHKSRQRLNPYFTISAVNKSIFPIVQDKVNRAISFLEKDKIGKQAPVDMDDIFSRIALDVISRGFISSDFDCSSGGYKYWPLPSKLKYWNAMKSIEKEIDAVIESRKKQDRSEMKDVLDILLADKEAGEISMKQLRGEIYGLWLAGHETTAHTMAFALNEIIKNKNVYERLMKEIDEVMPTNKSAPLTLLENTEQINKLTYLTAVIKETLRLHTPSAATVLTPIHDTTLGDYNIPSGVAVILCLYGVHHSTKYWDNPEEFNPDRFLDENNAASISKAFMPFSIGRHNCIGQTLAMLEAKMILALFLKNFIFKFQDGYKMKLGHKTLLCPVNGVMVTIEKRN